MLDDPPHSQLTLTPTPGALRRRSNQKDWTVRLQQFFDHHLKGSSAPEWIQKGVSFLDREEEKERFQESIEK